MFLFLLSNRIEIFIYLFFSPVWNRLRPKRTTLSQTQTVLNVIRSFWVKLSPVGVCERKVIPLVEWFGPVTLAPMNVRIELQFDWYRKMLLDASIHPLIGPSNSNEANRLIAKYGKIWNRSGMSAENMNRWTSTNVHQQRSPVTVMPTCTSGSNHKCWNMSIGKHNFDFDVNLRTC